MANRGAAGIGSGTSILECTVEWGFKTFAYADDLILILEARNNREVIFRATESLKFLTDCMEEIDLVIPPEKSEAVVLK